LRVLLYPTSDLAARAGAVLAGMKEVSAVAVLKGAPHRTHLPVTEQAYDFDVAVTDAPFELAITMLSKPLVLPSGSGPTSQTVLTDCSPRGLAIALGKWRNAPTVAYTVPSEVSGAKVSFPPPIGTVPGRRVGSVAGIQIQEAGAPGPWAGIRVETSPPLAMIDDRLFMEAIALAAGVSIVRRLPSGIFGPWENPEPYLRAAFDAGLVVATL